MINRTRKELTELAKENRKKSTPAEDKLWQELRNRKLDNIKFRRQEPIGVYIVDFISIEKNVIVEVDGGYHFDKDQKEFDDNRTKYLQFNDAQILRFTNEQVLNDIEGVLREIRKALNPNPSPEGRREQETRK